LIKPAFAEFDSLNKENPADLDYQTVLFGNAILASYQLNDNSSPKVIELPKEANWVQLSGLGISFKGGDTYTFTKEDVAIGV
jgi:hypothetical protein